MSNKKKIMFKVTALLMAYAVVVPLNSSNLFIGEPQLPKHIRKDDTMEH